MVRVRVSSNGKISLPKPIRDELELTEGAELEVSVKNQAVILRKIVPAWRRWRGAMTGSEVLKEHEEEHCEEVQRDVRTEELSEQERLRMLRVLDEIVARPPSRTRPEVNAELRAIRRARRALI